MLPSWHIEYLVQFLQRQSLGLGHEQKHTDPSNDAPGRVPCECTLRFEGRDERGPGEGEDEVETPRRSRSEGHAYLANVKGKCFSGIGKGDFEYISNSEQRIDR